MMDKWPKYVGNIAANT